MRRLGFVLAATTALAALPAFAGEYALVIDEQTVNITGKPMKKITVNGTIPGPALRFREGEEVVVRVTNRLKENTSVHWHGLILPPEQDGVPGFNGFPGIKPGETYTYRFPIQQSGTYWYHAHSATQEQSGHYGPLIIEPAGAPAVAQYSNNGQVNSNAAGANGNIAARIEPIEHGGVAGKASSSPSSLGEGDHRRWWRG